MQFQVPQFIEVEDKIFGPLTFKQFIYIAGGAGGSYLLWRMLPVFLAGPLIIIVGGSAAALAFFQFNGRPFIVAVEHAFFFLIHSKLYLWNNAKKTNLAQKQTATTFKPTSVFIPKVTDSKLHDLAWSLDIKERIAAGVADDQEKESHRAQNIVASMRTAQQARI
jgi:hypothetical protein